MSAKQRNELNTLIEKGIKRILDMNNDDAREEAKKVDHEIDMNLRRYAEESLAREAAAKKAKEEAKKAKEVKAVEAAEVAEAKAEEATEAKIEKTSMMLDGTDTYIYNS